MPSLISGTTPLGADSVAQHAVLFPWLQASVLDYLLIAANLLLLLGFSLLMNAGPYRQPFRDLFRQPLSSGLIQFVLLTLPVVLYFVLCERSAWQGPWGSRVLGVRAVVSLTEQPLSPASLSDNGIVAEHIPVADFTVPTIEQIERAVTTIDHFLAAGYASAVHCAAGPGRTGTILACALVARGQLATAAIGHVRAVWPGSIETPEQAAAVEQYERHLATG